MIHLSDTPCSTPLDSKSTSVSSLNDIMIKSTEYPDTKYIYKNDICVGVITGIFINPLKINEKIQEYDNKQKIKDIKYLTNLDTDKTHY